MEGGNIKEHVKRLLFPRVGMALTRDSLLAEWIFD